ncbi:MAG: BolA/IbaG family iron-sulfur metabolism protein [Pseudomonadales bacterium]|jgi:acid stress-induced BolA-like protein IbaG/YrbA|nr:BolA/IbaG family iron-sulfur metabolism protein [Pseudomonadales bacterium]MDP4641325.1 BolA/IbaG family iron-sulfur metabolism protein [Pseudomonadales bacterium]MDP4766323.1 BolA/IbaG family iron-sulfur metabolism protein [Pseudomonadales bacterium]MDP4876427.1 BolA/IbaG family iron-sulfur metabolism protein [Pseudomonadales bacterium]MDP4912444.1 BolA/IbaG family iron-sulfur metabolism protein [Pseudomonadales bacterium]
MNEVKLRELLATGLAAGSRACEVELEANGNKVMVVLVSEVFAGLSRVKRQQLVYKLLDPQISSGEIHAVSMRCLTPAEKNDAP